jgi:hypothetical protein
MRLAFRKYTEKYTVFAACQLMSRLDQPTHFVLGELGPAPQKAASLDGAFFWPSSAALPSDEALRSRRDKHKLAAANPRDA